MKFRFAHSLVAASLALGGLAAVATGPAHAQTAGATAAQVKMDRDTFLSMVRYDHATGMWVLRDGVAMPAGMLSAAEVKAMRDKFLSMNTWDPVNTKWVPVNGAPRDMSKLTREQIRTETEMFLKMHRFDEKSSTWMSRH